MDILGIGPLELFFVILIALIVLGPRDMVKAGRTIGRALRGFFMSDTWRVLKQASDEIRTLPNRMMREAGMEEIQEGLKTPDLRKDLGLDGIKADINKQMQVDISDWTTPPLGGEPEDEPENRIAPPESSQTAPTAPADEPEESPPDPEAPSPDSGEEATESTQNDEKAS